MQVPLVVGSAALAGARGAAAGFAMTTLFRTLIAWDQFRRGFVDRTASPEVVARDEALLETMTT
jgi:hypothetical protein